MSFLPNKDHPLFKDGYDAGLADGLRLAKSDAAILAALRAQASPDAVEALGKAAVDFINSYQDHIGRCRACDTAWQNLRIAVQNALKDSHGR